MSCADALSLLDSLPAAMREEEAGRNELLDAVILRSDGILRTVSSTKCKKCSVMLLKVKSVRRKQLRRAFESE